MQNSPLVTVIALCYNQEKYVLETLNSIKNQTYSSIQFIIIDDCSTDNSVAVIQEWINTQKLTCEFIKHEENWGLTKTCNDGLYRAKGKYYQVIACDDIMLPEKIERQVNILEKSGEDVAMVFSDAYLMQEDGTPHYGWFIQMHRNFARIPSGKIFEDLLVSNFIPAMSFLAKTEIVRDIGGYDEDLQYEDYDLWLRISEKYYIIFDDLPFVKYRIHSNNFHKFIFNSQWKGNQILIYSKFLKNEKAYEKFISTIKMYYKLVKKPNQFLFQCRGKIQDKILKFSIANNISFTNYIRINRILK